MNATTEIFYDFGPFRIDTQRRLLLRNGVPVWLKPKAFQVLLLLVQNSGRVVSKEEFFTHIWEDRHVEENNIAQNIFILRRILGEESTQAQYIVTIPGSGYSFVAPIKKVEDHIPRSTHQINSGFAANEKVAPQTCIAVLPFKALGKEQEDSYLRVGLADAIILQLSGLSNIIVRPTASVLRYSDSKEEVLSIGRELGVDFLLDGIFQHVEGMIRVSTQLIRVKDGATIWGAKFDEQFTNIFAVQDSISQSVAQALTLKLSREEQELITKRHTQSIEAHQMYLMGLQLWNKRSEAALTKSIEYFQGALELDQNYALAYAIMADAYALIAYNGFGTLSRAEAYEKSKIAASNALKLDHTLAEAYLPLAMVRLYYEGDSTGCEQALRHAFALNPNHPTVRHRFALYLVWKGYLQEGIKQMQCAQELDPISLSINSDLSILLIYARNYGEAIKYSKRGVEINPDYYEVRMNLATAYTLKGMYPEALAELEKASALDSYSAEALAGFGEVYAASGRRDEALTIVSRLENSNEELRLRHYCAALIYTTLNKKQEALKCIEKSLSNASCVDSMRLRFDPKLEALRSDPRFEEILRRHNLEHLLQETSKAAGHTILPT